MAQEWIERPTQDQRPAAKIMAAFKHNQLMASYQPNLYQHNSRLVLNIWLDFLNSYSNVADGLDRSYFHALCTAQWDEA
jgi:hypothetical protein